MAAADRFSVTVHGKGGHAAMPHLARDPVVAASAIVGALQHLVSRETSPTGSAVVTVAVFNTGKPHFALDPAFADISRLLQSVLKLHCSVGVGVNAYWLPLQHWAPN